VVKSGINVIVWAGDADWICNWLGNYEVANAVDFPGQSKFKAKGLAPYTVNGVEKGTFKYVDNFSFLRMYEAGHEVPYYRESSLMFRMVKVNANMISVEPEASLQVFQQILQKKPIFST
jgi:carboxypeptidase D